MQITGIFPTFFYLSREERRNYIIIKEVRLPKELEKDGKGGREWAADLINK